MKKTNRQIFEELSPDSYFKSVATAAKRFGEIRKYPDSLGFDDESNGFLVLHQNHAPAAFDEEIPVCVVLKKLGFAVILEDEEPGRGTADAQIDGLKFEIKQVSKAQNFKRAVDFHFRATCHKANRLLLHVAQTVNEAQLRGALFSAATNFPAIKIVWVVFGDELFCLDRPAILKKTYPLSHKK